MPRTGPIIVAFHMNMLDSFGPALQDAGGSRPRSINSYKDKKINRSVEMFKRGSRPIACERRLTTPCTGGALIVDVDELRRDTRGL